MARTDGIRQINAPGSYIRPIGPLGFDLLVYGSNKYLNFNTVSGTTGYGFRDNGGVMEYKNSLGSRTPIGSSSQTLATLPIDTNLEMGSFSLNTTTASYFTALSGGRSFYSIDSDVDDIIPETMSVFLQPRSPGGFYFGGVIPIPTMAGISGVHLWLYNDYDYGNTVIIPHRSPTSQYYFNNPSGLDITLQPGEGIHYQYFEGRHWMCADQYTTGGGGSGGLTYTAISADTTLSAGVLYDVTCSTANITLTLPALTANDTLEVRKADSTGYSVIINAPSIMGGTSISLRTQNEAVTLFYTGSTFIII